MLLQPQLFADLSDPFQKEDSQVFSSQIFLFSSNERKKRSEVLLGVDNKGISIYDVEYDLLIID